jgi:xanthine dehydrogenase large subunit
MVVAHELGIRLERCGDDRVVVGALSLSFAALALQDYLAHVQLWSDGFSATPKLHWDESQPQGHPFYYYAYGASVSEVLVDTFTLAPSAVAISLD